MSLSFDFAPNQVVTTAVDYMPPELSNELGNLQAAKISVAAHLPINATNESKTKTNHWCFYVEVGKAKSVRINMTVNVLAQSGSFDKAGFLGTLNVQNLPYLFSDTVTKSVTLDTLNAEAATVLDLVAAIQEVGYEKYDFESNGNGCRFWVIKVLELFKEKGFVGDITEAVEALQYAWDANKERLSKNSSASSVCGTFHHSAAAGSPE
jgi:hypothetical protein